MQAEDADADDRASKSKAGRKSSSAGTKEKKPRKFVITYCYDYGRKDVWQNYAILLKNVKLLPSWYLLEADITKVSTMICCFCDTITK